MTKKRKTKTVNKNQYRAFLAKAKDFAIFLLRRVNGIPQDYRLFIR